jgi:tetratricopeptide (TPR) repeat protein
MRVLTGVMLAATLGAAVLAAHSAPAAEPSEEQRQCAASTGVTPDQKLASCTAVIAAGLPTPQSLAIAYTNRGSAHYNKRDLDRAIADYDEAIRLDPKSVIPLNGRGLAYQSKSQYDRAIADFDQSIALNPKNAIAFNLRGNAYRIKGRSDRAIQDFGQAIELNPNYASAYFGRALAYQDKAQWDFDAYLDEGRNADRALKDYDEAIRLAPAKAAPSTTGATSI